MADIFIAFDETDRSVAEFLSQELNDRRFNVLPLSPPPPAAPNGAATVVIWSDKSLSNTSVSMAAGAAGAKLVQTYTSSVPIGNVPPGAIDVTDTGSIEAALLGIGVNQAGPPVDDPDWTFFYLLLGAAALILALISMIIISAPPETHIANCETLYTDDGQILEHCVETH